MNNVMQKNWQDLIKPSKLGVEQGRDREARASGEGSDGEAEIVEEVAHSTGPARSGTWKRRFVGGAESLFGSGNANVANGPKEVRPPGRSGQGARGVEAILEGVGHGRPEPLPELPGVQADQQAGDPRRPTAHERAASGRRSRCRARARAS